MVIIIIIGAGPLTYLVKLTPQWVNLLNLLGNF
jgi:hypothetical protein